MHKMSPITARCARAEIMAHCLNLGAYNQRFKKDEGFFGPLFFMLVQIVPVLIIDPSGEYRIQYHDHDAHVL